MPPAMRCSIGVLLLAMAACSSTSDDGDEDDGGGGGGAGGNGGEGGAGGSPANVANGTLEGWQTLAPMPEARANHCSAVVGGWLVVVGGNTKPAGSDEFVSSALVHAAKLEADGALGPWQQAGAMPSAVTECTAAAHGDELLVLDGIYADEAHEEQVWAATIDASGMFAAFTSIGSVPQRFLSTDAAVIDDTLYVMATQLPDSGDAVLTYSASLASGLGAWEPRAWLTGFRGKAQHAIADGAVFVMGGYLTGASEVVDRVDGAPITAGDVGEPFAGEALPQPTTSGDAIAVDGWVFVVGGRRQVIAGTAAADVVAAPIGASSLGPWAVLASLPEGRSNHELALGGDWLYLTGGGFDGPGLDTVFAARVRFPPGE
jgi:hypothetical protein